MNSVLDENYVSVHNNIGYKIKRNKMWSFYYMCEFYAKSNTFLKMNWFFQRKIVS